MNKVTLPDIGDFSDVEVIEVHVSVGDNIGIDDSILTLESDKATMDVPCPVSGMVTEIVVNLGDKISQGDHLISVEESVPESDDSKDPAVQGQPEEQPQEHSKKFDEDIPPAVITEQGKSSRSDYATHRPPPTLPPPVERSKGALPHASPSVRRFARELGADLSQIRGTGPKNRITRDNVQKFIKQAMQSGATPGGGFSYGPPPLPAIDFSKFGKTELVKLSRIKRITANRLHRSWLDIPHVTHHDEADITNLELFRKAVDAEAKIEGIRVTILAFICKAIVNALQEFPTFNASLSPDGQNLILKRYFNIGVAVDTPNGLVVPVVRDIRNTGIIDIAKLLQDLGETARSGKLTPPDFEGGCFTISSLGGIGGRFFTPIINPPEVAILGVSRHYQAPVPAGSGIEWKTALPLSLSYDHRVIDGAEAARFTKYFCELLYDSRRILL